MAEENVVNEPQSTNDNGNTTSGSGLKGCLSLILIVVVVGFIGSKVFSCGGGKDEVKVDDFAEKFYQDNTNFKDWKNRDEDDMLQSFTLSKDSTFKVTFNIRDYGNVELSGKWRIDNNAYNIYDKDYLLYKDLNLTHKLYRRIILTWDNDISSFHVTGNAFVGIPFKVKKPGYCGSRNFNQMYDYVLIYPSDNGKVTELGVIHSSCQEVTGKRFVYIERMNKN